MLVKCSSIIIPTIITINISTSLSPDHFNVILKQLVISTLRKKATLDKDQLSNY